MGFVWIILLNGPLWLGAWWLARYEFGRRGGLDGLFATVILGWTWLTIGLEILGSMGWMTRGPLLGWSSLLLCAGWVSRRRSQPSAEAPIPQKSGWRTESVICLGLVIWTIVTVFLPSLLMPVKVVSDGPIYHLYFAARWWKAARLILVATPFGENAATYFPANGDLWFTWLFLGFGGDRLAKVGQAPFLLMAAMSVYAMARRVGASADSSLLATLPFVSSSPLLFFTFEANVDTIFIAAYLASCYFGLDLWEHRAKTSSLILAGLAAGLAWGTKATGTVFVPPLIIGLAWVGLRDGNRWKRLAMLGFTVVLTCGFWFCRNAWLTGNPLYPIQVTLFGQTILTGWYGPEVMKLSQFYIAVEDWRAAIDQILVVLDPRLALFYCFAVVLGVVHGWRRDRRLSVISILVLLNIALFWLAIPYRTQQRFIFHALGLAVVPLAMMLDRSRWLRVGFATLIALHIFTGQDWPFGVFGQAPPWDFSPLVSHSTDGLINLSSSPIMLWARGIGSLLIALTWAWANWRPSPQRIATGLISSIALVAVLIGLNVGRASAPFPIFPAFRDYYLGWLDLEGRSGPGGLRIAYSGTNIPYYLMGRDFRNEIRYINTDAHRDWLLHDYHRAAIARGVPNWPYPRPGWDRTNPNYEAWLANLRAAGIQVLVVARANPEEGPHNIYDSQGFPIERFWAETHPTHFSPLYGVTENDPLFRSYRILNPRK